MDTLNSAAQEAVANCTSNMSTSESHSEKTISDDEDFKTHIPSTEDDGGVARTVTLTASSAGSFELRGGNLETEEACLDDDLDDDLDDGADSSFNYNNWQADDLDVDLLSASGGGTDPATSGAGAGTDYASPSCSGSESGSNFYPPSATATLGFGYRGGDSEGAMPDIKYPPNEMLLRPPATAGLHYNYNYPASRPGGSGGGMPSYPHPHQLAHPQTHHVPYAPSFPGGGPPYASTTHGFQPHPNMWYPNAPYGTGGVGPGGGGFYGSPYGGHRYLPYGAPSHRYVHDPMLDMLQLSNSGREARNRAEKNRRDKLNGSIQELSTMVPHVAESPRRVDKTAVLRFAAHGLRVQYVFGDTLHQPRPQITDTLMKLLDSFFITLTCHGQIILISASIEQHLGHCQADLYGQNILHIAHPEDHNMLKQQLIPTDLENLFDVQHPGHSAHVGIGCGAPEYNDDEEFEQTRARTTAEEEAIDRRLREDRRNFTVRLARAGPRSEATVYEVVKFDGCFRRSDAAPRGTKTSNYPPGLQLIRRSRGRDDSTLPLHTISGNDIVLIAIARIVRPPKVISRIVENTLEYQTRHLIDGRIIDCDQRIGLVAGYMTDEVRNLSPFTFMHQDDVRWVIVALRQMYDCSSPYGESTYRLLTRNGNFIYLQSKGYLEIDKKTNQVRSFICINTLLEEDEGRRRVEEMKRKFSAIIDADNIPQTSVDAPASDNPQQLEKAVLCLIQNLQKSSSTSDCDDDDISDASTSQYAASSSGNAISGKQRAALAATGSGRSTKTSPLALVPPEAASVKTSISKSVNAVNVTAAKNFRGNQRARSPPNGNGVNAPRYQDDTRYDLDFAVSPSSECTCRLTADGECEDDGDCKYCEGLSMRRQAGANTPTTTKRSSSESMDEFISQPKRRRKTIDVEDVLSSSLDQIDGAMDQQVNAAIELRDQCNDYDMLKRNKVEQGKKILVNIKSEYEVRLQQGSRGNDKQTTKTNISNNNNNSQKPIPVHCSARSCGAPTNSSSSSGSNKQQAELRPR